MSTLKSISVYKVLYAHFIEKQYVDGAVLWKYMYCSRVVTKKMQLWRKTRLD
jgi:hypothetical protein